MKIDFKQGEQLFREKVEALEELGQFPRIAIGPDSELVPLSIEEPPGVAEYRGRGTMVAIPVNLDGSPREPKTLHEGRPWTRPAGYHLYDGHTHKGWVGGPTSMGEWIGNLLEPFPDGNKPGRAQVYSDGLSTYFQRGAPTRNVRVNITVAGFQVTLATFTANRPEAGRVADGPAIAGPGAHLEASSRVRPCYWEALREAGAALEALHAKCAPSWLELLRLGAKDGQ